MTDATVQTEKHDKSKDGMVCWFSYRYFTTKKYEGTDLGRTVMMRRPMWGVLGQKRFSAGWRPRAGEKMRVAFI